MFWYLLNIFIIISAWIWPVHHSSPLTQERILQIRNKRTSIIATINWIILSGFRSWSIGDDTLTYKLYYFDPARYSSWSNLWANIHAKYIEHENIKDPAYQLIGKAFHVVSHDYQAYLLFIALIFFIPLGFYIYRHSRNACLSFILFSCLFYAFFAITGHRQTIATAIAFFAGIPLIRNRRLILFILLIAVASGIHASVVCFLPFYWASKIPINKWTLSAYWIVIVCVFAYHTEFLSLLQSIVGYEEYGQEDYAGGLTFMCFLFLMAFFATIFFKKIMTAGNSYNQMSMNALFLACLFSPLLQINPSFMRVIQYYSTFLLFLIPEFGYIFQTQKDRNIFYCICCAVLITLLIITGPKYEFCWD